MHSFSSAGRDGQRPFAGLTWHNGAFYGTTDGGGPHQIGTVYALKLVNGVWKQKVLYAFTGRADGDEPQSNVIFDNAGNLYGTTYYGGSAGLGNGVVFKLSPSNGAWTQSVIHTFAGGIADGANPTGGLTMDAAGNLYGSTGSGGTHNAGIVFKLSPSGNNWSETILYNFGGKPDGAVPLGDLVFDGAGNLYGTTIGGGANRNHNPLGDGTVFELSPNPDGSWSETILHSFGSDNDGALPRAGLTLNSGGTLYGTTPYGGGTPNGGHGTAFQLALMNGIWTESVISNFTVAGGGNFPQSPLVIDQAGNLLGVANGGGQQNGVVYKLSFVNGTWQHTALYSFPNTASGVHPIGNLVLDSSGNIYGATVRGGEHNFGVIYAIAP
ncbi:MAG TPA: choice-of-anchor tandem repeat GloVer-containing protein [Terriglobales bacterium]